MTNSCLFFGSHFPLNPFNTPHFGTQAMVISHIGPVRWTNLNPVDYEVGKIMDSSDLITDGWNLLFHSHILRSGVCSVNSGDISGTLAVAQLCTFLRALRIKLGKLISIACARPVRLSHFSIDITKLLQILIIDDRNRDLNLLLLCTLTQLVAYVCAQILTHLHAMSDMLNCF